MQDLTIAPLNSGPLASSSAGAWSSSRARSTSSTETLQQHCSDLDDVGDDADDDDDDSRKASIWWQ